MLGKNIASIEKVPRRIIQSLWGIPDIHMRQKWITMWPILESLPQEGLEVLDAGCGPGIWPLEIAARRPRWNITGIDLDQKAMDVAEAKRQKIGLGNVRFQQADFLNFEDHQRYDVVMSLFAAHCCVEIGRGDDLFQHFNKWLKPGGLLILLVPRRLPETPFIPWLTYGHWQQVFSREELVAFCTNNGFTVRQLSGRIGRLGALAKQIDLTVKYRVNAVSGLSYPLVWSMMAVDQLFRAGNDNQSLWWELIAKKPDQIIQLPRNTNLSLVEV